MGLHDSLGKLESGYTIFPTIYTRGGVKFLGRTNSLLTNWVVINACLVLSHVSVCVCVGASVSGVLQHGHGYTIIQADHFRRLQARPGFYSLLT